MRTQFDRQLTELNHQMISIGMLCETAIIRTSEMLLGGDAKMAGEVSELLSRIEQKEREIEGICMKLLLHQQPVAGDLRTVSSALKMVTDLQRIGTQSADIAEIVSLGNIHRIPEFLPISEMTKAVIQMVTESIDSFVRKDSEIARAVTAYDDVVDDLFSKCKSVLIAEMKEPQADSEMLVDLLMIAKYYERIGDHAVNIAGWVQFSITGSMEM